KTRPLVLISLRQFQLAKRQRLKADAASAASRKHGHGLDANSPPVRVDGQHWHLRHPAPGNYAAAGETRRSAARETNAAWSGNGATAGSRLRTLGLVLHLPPIVDVVLHDELGADEVDGAGLGIQREGKESRLAVGEARLGFVDHLAGFLRQTI